MAAFDNINYAALADKFQKFYDIFNATMTALKAGASNYLLTANGIGNSPVFTPIWSSWQTVDSSVGLDTGLFQLETNPDLQLKVRYSSLFNIAQMSGNLIIKATTFTPNDDVAIFNMPSSNLPIKVVYGSLTKENASGVSESQITLIINPSTAQVSMANSSIYASSVGEHYYFNITYPLS